MRYAINYTTLGIKIVDKTRSNESFCSTSAIVKEIEVITDYTKNELNYFRC